MNPLLENKPGRKQLLLGNTAIVRGAIEAGVAFVTCYPGTPSSEISDTFFQLSNESDIYFEYSTNEKVALEVGAGAACSNLRTLVAMKHVGVNVAADPLMTLAYVGVEGGMVVISADDPYLFSSQNEQDNRYYGKLSGLPILEPSSAAEAKDMVKYAFDLSEELNLPVIFRTTTRINHSRGIVTFGEMRERVTRGEFIKNPGVKVTLPGVSRGLHQKLLEKYAQSQALSNASPLNSIEGQGRLGILTNGVSHAYVSDALNDLNAKDAIAVLRLGFSHPFPKKLVQDFMKDKEKILVVEELEFYMEEEARAAAQEVGLTLPIAGKSSDLFSRLFEFDPGMVRANIAKYFSLENKTGKPVDVSNLPEIPARPPGLCAGCPHRSTFYSIKKIAGEETVYPTDIGCYTLGFMPPLRTADLLLCMGSSITTACGISRATGKKTVAFIGDSTFFHGGITGLVDAVHNRHNVLLIILDNGTTAMTGHQIHPGVDASFFGKDNRQISIEEVVRGVGVEDVRVVQPRNLAKTQEAIKAAMDHEGISVIISQEVCPLYARRIGELPKRPIYQVDLDRCTNHRDCLNLFACPAFYLDGNVRPGLSGKRDPSGEKRRMMMNATRIHITGVGGQGTLLATSLIGEAALLAGVNVNISEVHGMAQRGGVVESAVVMGDALSSIVSNGEADILLGFEPSETLRAAVKCGPGTLVVTNSHPLPPFTVSIGQGTYPDLDKALPVLKQRVKDLVSLDADALAHEAGNVLSLNMVMLGALLKHAVLPVTAENIKEAITQNTRKDFLDINLKAFELGYNH